MNRHSQGSFGVWLASFLGGAIVALLFARKKGATLRAELVETGETAGMWAQVVGMKNEFGSMLEEVQDVWESDEVQKAFHQLVKLTNELLPRIEGESKKD